MRGIKKIALVDVSFPACLARQLQFIVLVNRTIDAVCNPSCDWKTINAARLGHLLNGR